MKLARNVRGGYNISAMKHAAIITAIYGCEPPAHRGLAILEKNKAAAEGGYFQGLVDGFKDLTPEARGALVGGAGLAGLGALSGMFSEKGKGRKAMTRGLLGALLGAGGGYLLAPQLQGLFTKPRDPSGGDPSPPPTGDSDSRQASTGERGEKITKNENVFDDFTFNPAPRTPHLVQQKPVSWDGFSDFTFNQAPRTWGLSGVSR